MASLHLLCIPSKFQAIVPSRTLSVTQLLIFKFPASLETNPSCTSIVLSQEPPKVQLPADFISQSVPAFSTAMALRDHATSAWQDGDQSIMHPSIPPAMIHFLCGSYHTGCPCIMHLSINVIA